MMAREGDLAAPARDGLRDLSPERRALLTMKLARGSRSAAKGIRRTGRTTFPLSYAQERLWFLDQADPGSVAYVIPAALRIRGRLDIARLRRCLQEIVRRHEVLRSTYAATDSGPVQRVRDADAFPLPVSDLTGLDGEERERAVRDGYAGEVARPFALDRDRPIRAELLCLADDHHVLLLSIHHIAADGWSLGVLVGELVTLYRAFAAGEASPLPELPVQYGDYALWQRSALADDSALEREIAYWRSRLDGAPLLDLPTDRPRTTARTWRGSSESFRLPVPLVRGIGTVGEETGATPYMVLLAAFAVLLFRWSGQTDLIVGVPVAHRDHPDIERLVGFFVNTLAVRIDLGGDPSFRDLVSRMARVCAEGYANQDVPFERLVRVLELDRSASPVPLVQAMLAMRNVPMPSLELRGLDLSLLDLRSQASKFDLSFELVPERNGDLTGRAEYSTDLFAAATVRRMVEAFGRILRACVADPDARIDRIPVLGHDERTSLLKTLGGGGAAAAGGPAARPPRRTPRGGGGAAAAADAAGCLHTLIGARAADRLGTLAVVDGVTGLTYGELGARTNRLAWHLSELGAGPERLVGVSMPRSVETVVALLAVLRAGAAYVPLDPTYPKRRVEQMVRESGVSIMITTEGTANADTLAAHGARIVRVDCDADTVDRRPDTPPPSVAVGRNLAYVIFTSGSTGMPKGSGNEHGGVANTLDGLNATLGLTPEDRMLAVSSLNYDMSVYEIFGTLLAGARVVVPDDGDILDPDRLTERLIDQGVTVWSSAPALFDMLLAHWEKSGVPDGCALRLAMLGGDRIPPLLISRLRSLLPHVRLYNLAGMTETSYCTTYHLIRDDEPAASAGTVWGRPLPNQSVYVLGSAGEPVPVGVVGELHVGGSAVRRGYWGRPGLTAERFVPDAYGPDRGGRLYRTGDRVRWRSDGELEFVGRLDFQVKVRGFRIEMGDVEAALSYHPDVRDVTVTIRTDFGEPRLIAYLTTTGPVRPAVGELRAHVRDRLPAHMVPSAFVFLDALPLQPSGKIDRSALPPPPQRPETSRSYVPPTGALELVLAGVWSDLLGVERVGADDDFFELGGHSLLVTQVASRLRELFRMELPIRELLTAVTVGDLARRMRLLGAGGGGDVDQIAELVRRVGAMTEEEVADSLRE